MLSVERSAPACAPASIPPLPAPMPLLTAESPVSAVAAFDDNAWEDLLNHIEEKRVILVVSSELTGVHADAGPEIFYV